MTASNSDLSPRAQELYEEILESVYRRRDRVFVKLFFAQWVFALAMALLWSPRGWEGKVHSTHLHVYYAIVFGAALTLPTVYVVRTWPGAALTRYAIAVVQVMWSALLIHLSGGRIETHFHVFGSLAFLAFYRDWRVLVPATIGVAGDHLIRGILWSESVYGITNPEWWRFIEHAFWVGFENAILVMGIRESRREMRALAERQAALEVINFTIEQKVVERTNELGRANARLVEASRRAGMADVATSVLHNVGNVLNSANVAAGVVSNLIRTSALSGLARSVALLKGQPDPARFFAVDPKGRTLVEYLYAVTDALMATHERVLGELASLERNLEHIKVIVSMQQSHAKAGGVVERIRVRDLVDEVVRLNEAALANDGVTVVKQLDAVDEIELDRHKVLQILVNLLTNARQALTSCNRPRRLTISTRNLDGERIAIAVTDNGSGIAKENLARIFSHGFTTKKEGHGFGLHGSANMAAELGGTLGVASGGEDRGATFTLVIPKRPSSAKVAA